MRKLVLVIASLCALLSLSLAMAITVSAASSDKAKSYAEAETPSTVIANTTGSSGSHAYATSEASVPGHTAAPPAFGSATGADAISSVTASASHGGSSEATACATHASGTTGIAD